MVLIKPEAGVGHQEVAHLAAAEVEDVRPPIRMLAAGRIRVLIQWRSIETAQCEGVLREVRRDPIHDYTDTRLVKLVDEILEVVGGAQAGVHAIIAGHLIAPAAEVRVFLQRHEFHVGEAQLRDVRHELVGKLAVAVYVVTPTVRIYLVDRHGTLVRVGFRALGHPVGIVPMVFGLHHNRGRLRWHLVRAFHWVGLHLPSVEYVENLIFVFLAGRHTRDKDFPDAGGAEFAHRMADAVPSVEIAHHSHRMCIRRPDGECSADHRFAMGAIIATHGVLISLDVGAHGLP